MKTIFSILLALNLFLAGVFPVSDSEWAKLSQLIEHFEDHKKETKADMSFLDFLLLHYYSEHGKCGHSDIPHCCHTGSALIYFITYPETIAIDVFVSELGFSREFFSFNYFFNLVHSLLQPPQILIFRS